MSAARLQVSRRGFLQASLTASGGLLLQASLPVTARAQDATAPPNPIGINLRIERDNRVFIGSPSPRSGRGSRRRCR